ncbi:molybdenum cofactor biosynthesis protein B [Aeromonas simiae]|uniref:molybdenum cofactor biosynthesis protein B n=1 Tax=Aeromonas simiae TaxID=218936 RepID=UPI0005A652F7|nr:molybdenum cofactor biosynthesis protein B [Aeromonas simiae]
MARCAAPFRPLSIAVLTVTDSRTLEQDSSGDYLADVVRAAGHRLAERALLPNDRYRLRALVSAWIADPAIEAVVINGGTGFYDHNQTPEAIAVLFDRPVEGFGELFRQLSFAELGSASVQSRAIAGLANRTAIFCLPGSTGACRLGWEQLIAPQLDASTRPCNFVSHLGKESQ